MMKWLFNPFTYIAGNKALILGWLIMLLTAVVSWRSNAHLDGVIDMHFATLSLSQTLFEPLIDWGCTSLVFLLLSLFLSRTNVRYIDIFGTMALARWPMLLASLLGFGVTIPHIDKSNPMSAISSSILISGVVYIFLAIWMIALMYNAFVVSCNLKGQRATIGFIVGLMLAEVISKLIFWMFII